MKSKMASGHHNFNHSLTFNWNILKLLVDSVSVKSGEYAHWSGSLLITSPFYLNHLYFSVLSSFSTD